MPNPWLPLLRGKIKFSRQNFCKHNNTFGGLLLFGRGTARWVARAVLPRVTVLVFTKAFNAWVNHRSQAEAKTSHRRTFNMWVNHRSFASLGEDLQRWTFNWWVNHRSRPPTVESQNASRM